MDSTVRIWNLSTGDCQHVLNGHTSLVGLLGLSPSYLVSAAADSTLRVWNPETGELCHALAAHNGAITCFQHDEFKVLSGSDGTLKMWDIRDGSHVRDLLVDIVGVWQVVFEGRWCVAASNRADATVLDVWDFGTENDGDDGWVGEPPGGIYDEDEEEEDEEEDIEQAEVDAMEQELGTVPSDTDDVDLEDAGMEEEDDDGWSQRTNVRQGSSRQVGSPHTSRLGRQLLLAPRSGSGSSRPRILPSVDETPTRPKTRHYGVRRR